MLRMPPDAAVRLQHRQAVGSLCIVGTSSNGRVGSMNCCGKGRNGSCGSGSPGWVRRSSSLRSRREDTGFKSTARIPVWQTLMGTAAMECRQGEGETRRHGERRDDGGGGVSIWGRGYSASRGSGRGTFADGMANGADRAEPAGAEACFRNAVGLDASETDRTNPARVRNVVLIGPNGASLAVLHTLRWLNANGFAASAFCLCEHGDPERDHAQALGKIGETFTPLGSDVDGAGFDGNAGNGESARAPAELRPQHGLPPDSTGINPVARCWRTIAAGIPVTIRRVARNDPWRG